MPRAAWFVAPALLSPVAAELEQGGTVSAPKDRVSDRNAFFWMPTDAAIRRSGKFADYNLLRTYESHLEIGNFQVWRIAPKPAAAAVGSAGGRAAGELEAEHAALRSAGISRDCSAGGLAAGELEVEHAALRIARVSRDCTADGRAAGELERAAK